MLALFISGRTYGNLEHELLVVVGGLERVQDSRQLGAIELDWIAVS